ncbi:uncharacterized protein CANTADRAFT_23107 [Suhomyces tanzawaensis NRRL Y-17324]|uniref:C2H2-type domain-containing protein n=1 Tax=Suhomyces tanzawaensis NRRL Y-17324 TaxID=984487 RepID=A0A1E4SEV3_9ASCO|nr:uncharacterized protein CANTADRAFT_23107 [Suhomyces tanzawaensis NRRL Y-17324]ODV77996.1 hypothetical protein CANTADRAFT_23107 [Suhomyces tanzawaensis NRRL Y-17324]
MSVFSSESVRRTSKMTSKTSSKTPSKSSTFVNFTLVAIALRLLQVGISYVLALLVPFPESLSIPSDSQFFHHINRQPKKSRKKSSRIVELDDKTDLFPSIRSPAIVPTASAALPLDKNVSYAQPCSTGLTTKLLPYKNENGEIEWAFTDDGVSSELDVFKQGSHQHFNPEPQFYNEYDEAAYEEEDDANLSPTISNSSNNDSIISSSNKAAAVKKEDNNTPGTNHSSPFTPNDQHLNHDHHSGSISSCSSSEDIALGDSSFGVPDGKIHQCPHCDATFKIRGYLTRHLKKHATKKAYSCPFHEFSVFIDENDVTHKCHPNGGFSRRDTYKTHLKSRHFKYPKGTKTKERAKSAGSCSMCGETFPNAEIWCELHVEGAECKFLPSGFKGKSRIKNRIKKQLTKQQQKEFEKSGGIYSKHFALASAVSSKKTNGLSQVSGECSTPAMDTPVSANNSTPIPSSINTYGYKHISNSPAVSISSSINNEAHTSPDAKVSSSYTEVKQEVPVVQHNPIDYSQHFYSQSFQPTHIDHYQMGGEPMPSFEAFDDDQFCLDIDQLNNATFNNFNEIIEFMKAQHAVNNLNRGNQIQQPTVHYGFDQQAQHQARIQEFQQQEQLHQNQYQTEMHQQDFSEQSNFQPLQSQQCFPVKQQYQMYSNPNPVMYN